MTNQRHAPNDHVADYHAPEPSVPATHDCFELTEDTLIVYRQGSPRQWVWADNTVDCAEHR
jgi:hypothetical protein